MAKTYTTVQGDTWDAIAKKTLGDEYRMVELIEANAKRCETVIFSGGIAITIPEVDTKDTLDLPPWKR